MDWKTRAQDRLYEEHLESLARQYMHCTSDHKECYYAGPDAYVEIAKRLFRSWGCKQRKSMFPPLP